MDKKITILSERPYVIGFINFGFFIRKIKILLITIKNFYKKTNVKYYPCHSRVSEEVFEGLSEIGTNYKIDPLIIKKDEAFLVLCHKKWLKNLYRIQTKQKIKVIVGPNVFHSIDMKILPIILSLRPMILTPSEWVAKNYRAQIRDENINIRVWPCGVDESYWRPRSSNQNYDTVIIYRKCDDFDKKSINRIESYIESFNLRFVTLNYGSYSLKQWKHYLNKSVCVIYLTSKTESQGIAQFEAWSMGVPTFVLKITDCNVDGWSYIGSNSSPYLNAQSGEFWTHLTELFNLLKNLFEKKNIYDPRKYVIEQYSRKSKSLELLDYFRDE